MSLVHPATCVAVHGRAVLIEGPSGSGKSALALALIDRGAVLIGDDGVTLEQRGNALLASPPPRIAGLLEVRNLGLLTFPVAAAVARRSAQRDQGRTGTGPLRAWDKLIAPPSNCRAQGPSKVQR